MIELNKQMADCKACTLYSHRTRVVPGEGNRNARLMFIGEAPGRDEDQTGLPFVGRAGKLLTPMIESVGFRRDEVFVANICKCRPENNRTPTNEEMETCFSLFLSVQIETVNPDILCLLGKTACESILKLGLSMRDYRQGNPWRWGEREIHCTYHPAYLLRNEDAKVDTWEDLKKLKAAI